MEIKQFAMHTRQVGRKGVPKRSAGLQGEQTQRPSWRLVLACDLGEGLTASR